MPNPKTRVHRATHNTTAIQVTYEDLVTMIDQLPTERRMQLAMAMIQTSLQGSGQDAFYGEIKSPPGVFAIVALGKRGQQLKEITHKFVADSFEENTSGYVDPAPRDPN